MFLPAEKTLILWYSIPKNNAPCEEKQDMRQLTEEELEQVSGGVEINTIGCSGMTHSAAVVEE